MYKIRTSYKTDKDIINVSMFPTFSEAVDFYAACVNCNGYDKVELIFEKKVKL